MMGSHILVKKKKREIKIRAVALRYLPLARTK